MTAKHFLLSHSNMTPTERRVGRFLRAPDGHPEGSAPASDAGGGAPAQEAAPVVENNTDALYEQEFGGGDSGEASGEGEGQQAEAKGEPEADKLTAAEQRAADAERRAQEATERAERAEREAQEARDKGKAPAQDDAKPAPGPDDAPNPENYEFGEADSKFIRDLARYEARAEFKRQEQHAQLQSELDGVESNWKTAIADPSIVEEYPDFDDKVTKGADREDWYCTPLMAIAIKASPVGAHVAYELATNKAESQRIAGLSEIEQAYEIGKLEGKVAAGRTAKATTTEPKKLSSDAPEPPANRSRGGGGQFVSDQSALYDKMLTDFR